MSVQEKVTDKNIEKTEEASEKYVNENKWQVCHILYDFK